jgi:ABC-type transport system involved in multi-copper enzyme maturation permease subunit
VSAAAIAVRMTGADALKLRKKRGAMIWATLLALGPIVIYFLVSTIQHASNPGRYGPAGGAGNFRDGLRVIALFFGPLAALLIGVEAGAGDSTAGVLRDLIVTGRSRIALFASRVPAALAITWLLTLAAYALLLIGTFAFAGGLPTPDGALIANSLGWVLLATAMMCLVAVGFSSLTASKPAAIIALIAWLVVASPLLASIKSLGGSRDWLMSQAVAHFSPVHLGEGGHGASVTMSDGTATLVLAAWLVVFLALGAWRTRTMDA